MLTLNKQVNKTDQYVESVNLSLAAHDGLFKNCHRGPFPSWRGIYANNIPVQFMPVPKLARVEPRDRGCSSSFNWLLNDFFSR
jgi:hypothetical protein